MSNLFNVRNHTGLDQPIGKVDAKYIGGYKAAPKSKNTSVLFFPDRIEIKEIGLTIPFRSIINVENQDAERITKTRVLLLGLIGVFWKKRYLYTVLEYDDGLEKQFVILDFHREVNRVQGLINQKMIEFRK
jgi:hypothetical protein